MNGNNGELGATAASAGAAGSANAATASVVNHAQQQQQSVHASSSAVELAQGLPQGYSKIKLLNLKYSLFSFNVCWL